ncbi:hypothetical protein AB6D34_09300 [Pectobacterium brasiliense]|uniref:Uncharacterized protein n=1 Tax=Pectobacterium brasiliense TaxID=180957 RepID=A0A7T0HTP0_9GAMM|nr:MULTISPECIES: hypothetical protein [Pectobacterium]MBN3046532.1 hypothetical protein [Pectobacterium brasiliense]MBN3056785.1 hypothetical protein [Pectobacterium brasiliense]MBN3075335.1 hypothetical protein [Pectobacterium brasiliense]MBN3083539.1 hypothetical protein [Pectobacterium brasiliense]MBN3089079.1 hypothetical protein [Pectobacterium brasiliense]
MTLIEYINKYFGGNQAAFARHISKDGKLVRPQKVQDWINAEWLVIESSDGVKLCSVRRELPQPPEKAK